MSLILRPFQAQALRALESPGHVLCISPTGSGKSLIFETWAKRPGTRMLLVTPLVALARQQAAKLETAGIKVHSTAAAFGFQPLTQREAWILSPESLESDRTLQQIQDWRPNFLVMDECHCLWEWGRTFRPAFQRVPQLLQENSSIQRSLWLTATLSAGARASLKTVLPQPMTELGSFSLPANLQMEIRKTHWPERPDTLIDWIRPRMRFSGDRCGLVFVQTREWTLRLTRLLTASGIEALPYHAGMSREERQAVEAELASPTPRTRVVVATSAFGMGMHFERLGWAVLWQAPPTLLSLAQAIGRAGRNHSRAEALLFWSEEDFQLIDWMLQGSPDRTQELAALFQFYGHAGGCRAVKLARYFDGSQANEVPCGRCDACRKSLGVSVSVADSVPSRSHYSLTRRAED